MIFTCRSCHQDYNLDVTESQLFQHKHGQLAQTVFSNLTSDEREIIISGICGVCYDELFKLDEDETE